MIVEVQSNIMEIEECFDYEKDFLEYKKYLNDEIKKNMYDWKSLIYIKGNSYVMELKDFESIEINYNGEIEEEDFIKRVNVYINTLNIVLRDTYLCKVPMFCRFGNGRFYVLKDVYTRQVTFKLYPVRKLRIK